MKRTRDVTEIRRELGEADAKRRALERELQEHPDEVATQKRLAREHMATVLPRALHSRLLDRVTALRIDETLEDDDGAVVYTWDFRATIDGHRFQHKSRSRTDSNDADAAAGVGRVDFVNDAVWLWYRALDANDGHPRYALAALCYACCEHVSDFTANPAAAFAEPKPAPAPAPVPALGHAGVHVLDED
jgi:hypothetical protein